MKVFLDISHPAYAHALKPLVFRMQEEGHAIKVFARDKDLTHYLLKTWGIPFISKGKGGTGAGSRIRYSLYSIGLMLVHALRARPDVLISFSSWHLALTGFLIRRPVLTLEDTEDVSLLHTLNRMFSTKMLTPVCFEKDFGKKQVRFPSYKELAYLYGRDPGEAFSGPPAGYILLRFVSRTAFHDRDHPGIPDTLKRHIVQTLAKRCRLYISTEYPLPDKWKEYAIPCRPEDFHALLSRALLCFSESASVAAEASVLGVPAIFIDNTGRGYTRELEDKYKLLFNFPESEEGVHNALELAQQLLNNPQTPDLWKQRREQMLSDKTDLTEWIHREIRTMDGLINKY